MENSKERQISLDEKVDEEVILQECNYKIWKFQEFAKANVKPIDTGQCFESLISDLINVDWESFFHKWDKFIPNTVKDSPNFKAMTLKFRVHFAILPVRILHLHQDKVEITDSAIRNLMDNALRKFGPVNDEKDAYDEKSILTMKSRKQLESFFNSEYGQKLANEFQNSPYMPYFGIPYIPNPEKDESVKEIFTLQWLEDLLKDMKVFISNSNQNDKNAKEASPKNFPVIRAIPSRVSHEPRQEEPNFDSSSPSVDQSKEKPDLMSENKLISFSESQIREWFSKAGERKSLVDKFTQTQISSLKSGTGGFALISESEQVGCVVVPRTDQLSYVQSHSEKLDSKRAELNEVKKKYRNLKIHFNKLHNDYEKLNEVAEELTLALENTVRGESINFQKILNSCRKIYPERFNSNNKNMIEHRDTDSRLSKSPGLVSETIIQKFSVLDYQKVREQLSHGQIELKVLLLQHLRQKITINANGDAESIIDTYVNCDILGIDSTLENNKKIIPELLLPEKFGIMEKLAQQSLARFFNVLASWRRGRDYLSSTEFVINTIMKFINQYEEDEWSAVTMDMLIATIQKMSLRRMQRKLMVGANMVEWLTRHLNNQHHDMSLYRLEYASALLMNLSLRSDARLKSADYSTLLVSALIKLLSPDYLVILPYVNGALQNFLMNDGINEEAEKLNLAATLEFHSEAASEDYGPSIQNTLRIHLRKCETSIKDDEFPDNDDNIFNLVDKEIEQHDPVKDMYDSIVAVVEKSID